MLCGREGNRRSGVALDTDFSGLSTYGLNGHQNGDEHPTYAPTWAWSTLVLESPGILFHNCSGNPVKRLSNVEVFAMTVRAYMLLIELQDSLVYVIITHHSV